MCVCVPQGFIVFHVCVCVVFFVVRFYSYVFRCMSKDVCGCVPYSFPCVCGVLFCCSGSIAVFRCTNKDGFPCVGVFFKVL